MTKATSDWRPRGLLELKITKQILGKRGPGNRHQAHRKKGAQEVFHVIDLLGKVKPTSFVANWMRIPFSSTLAYNNETLVNDYKRDIKVCRWHWWYKKKDPKYVVCVFSSHGHSNLFDRREPLIVSTGLTCTVTKVITPERVETDIWTRI
jgi:hypothetical protein